MEKEKFKFPTDYYYALLDSGSRRVTYYSNKTIDDAVQWYGWKPDKKTVFDKNATFVEARWADFFVGPFTNILHAKIYVLKRRKRTLLKHIEERPASQENLNYPDVTKLALADAADGEIKKVNKLLDKYMDLSPEHFI